MKPIGFLQEDFHSEVLSFLLELVSTKFANRTVVLYNNQDRYDNKSLYKQKYKNLTVRDLQYFFPDINKGVCEKVFVVSYDNIVHFSFFLPYKNDLIFIAHSPKHVDTFKKNNVKYFALTGLLSTDFMLPITNQIYSDEYFSHEKLNTDIANMDIMKTIRDRNLTVLLIVGSFFENNKDIDLLKELIDTKKYILVVCTTELTKELKTFVENNLDYVYVSLNLTTRDLRFTIKYFDIKYLLFTPPKDSKFYTSSWSGSIQFGFDNGLHIIIPEIIANMYNINNSGLIAYNSVNDITNAIESQSCLNNIKQYQNIRDSIFSRNKVVFDILLDDIKTSNIGHFRIEYHENGDNINKTVNTYQKIIDATLKPQDIKDKMIITVDSDTSIFMLTTLLLERSCTIEAFIKDLDTAKYYKNIFTYNNMNKRIKFFYGLLGSKNINKNDHEIYTLDHLKYTTPISIIYTNSDLIEDVIYGGRYTIDKYKPLIFVKHLDEQNKKRENLKQLLRNYSVSTIDNFSIYSYNVL